MAEATAQGRLASRRGQPLDNSLELAWAAGFYDGEGYTGVLKRTRRSYLGMSVAQVDRRPLERFCQAVGVGTINGPYERAAENHSASYKWSTGAKAAHVALDLLLPYLSEPKREQATAALSLLDELNADFRDMRLKENRVRAA